MQVASSQSYSSAVQAEETWKERERMREMESQSGLA